MQEKKRWWTKSHQIIITIVFPKTTLKSQANTIKPERAERNKVPNTVRNDSGTKLSIKIQRLDGKLLWSWEVWREFCVIFLATRQHSQTFWGIFQSIFSKEKSKLKKNQYLFSGCRRRGCCEGSLTSGVRKRVVFKRLVLSDVPLYQSSSAKWWFSLRMVWGFWRPGFRTSWQSSVCPKTLLTY